MTWTTYYHPPLLTLWQGRTDTPTQSSFFQIIEPLDLRENMKPADDNYRFGLVGFCCDEGIRRNFGRAGAKEGPDEIRKALAKLPIQKTNFICYDAGDIICDDEQLENAQDALAVVIAEMLKAGITPIVLGGGHELAFGTYQGIMRVHEDSQLGIVNFDAHFDMRPLLSNDQGSSGTPFLQIAKIHEALHKKFDYNCIGIQTASNIRDLFETAKNYQTHTIMADDLHQGYIDKCNNFIERIIDQNELIYVSLCLDVLAASYAPGVSAPQVFGLTPWQILPLIRQLASSGKVICYDIAELSPPFDIDHRTAKLAATFIYEIIHHHRSGKQYGNSFREQFTS